MIYGRVCVCVRGRTGRFVRHLLQEGDSMRGDFSVELEKPVGEGGSVECFSYRQGRIFIGCVNLKKTWFERHIDFFK